MLLVGLVLGLLVADVSRVIDGRVGTGRERIEPFVVRLVQVVLQGLIFGKPANATEAEQMLEELSGKTHVVLSGLCLVSPGWEVVEHEGTRVTFRELTPRDLAAYIATGEWEGRAGAYAIQGRGAALVCGIEGDYLNVVGLPAALLVRLLAERFAGTYGFG